MRGRAWLLFQIALSVVLIPLAFASPPDPSWVRGVYDDADFDDVVALLTSGAGAIDPFPSSAIGPGRVAFERAPSIEDESLPVVIPASSPSRAPPAF